MVATLHVCITCRGVEPAADPAAPRPGARLHDRILAEPRPASLDIRPVECLSACSQGCAVALSGPGKWTYVIGRLGDGDAAAIVRGATLYAATPDGLVPWRERPEIFRKQSLARVPPQETAVD